MPSIGLGTYGLRGQEGINVIRKALDVGYRHIDTAEFYENEAEVGQALSTSSVARKEIFITTKVWPNHFQRKDFLTSEENSLRRLKTGYIDLLLLHWPNDEVPLGQPLGALEKLIADGKVRNGGVSNFSVTQMKEARHLVSTVVSGNQVECHLGLVPKDIIHYATEHSIAITAYSPLDKGAITTQQDLRELAKKYDKTEAQIALRWLTQQGIAVIPKTKTYKRLEENLESEQFLLNDEDIDLLGRL
ncbi:aldo/keto reductase [Candidatus Tisiphia endosymbiont of Nemotelus uliginosus]|uniref:aldo/keto reductase n=1 Tax=Candidatus Tisiphia endosymbiont of Nemotelus uliginosus TaxID=3077926 RepID=UPI0035C921AD